VAAGPVGSPRSRPRPGAGWLQRMVASESASGTCHPPGQDQLPSGGSHSIGVVNASELPVPHALLPVTAVLPLVPA
jgi:hypothetical protein